MGKQWRIKTRTWVGVAAGAQHYNVELNCGGDSQTWRIERVMRPRDIAHMNRMRRSLGFPIIRMDPGEWCDGFDSEEDAVEAATIVFHHLKQEGDSLVWKDHLHHLLLVYGPADNEYTYYSGVSDPRRSAIVKRTMTGWEFVELEEE